MGLSLDRCKEAFVKVVESPDESSVLDRLLLRACTQYLAEGKLDYYKDYQWAESISKNKNFYTATLLGLGAYALWWAIDLANYVSYTLWGTLALITALGLVAFSVIAIFGGIAVRYLDRPLRELRDSMPTDMVFGWFGGSLGLLYHYRLEKKHKI